MKSESKFYAQKFFVDKLKILLKTSAKLANELNEIISRQ